MLVDTAYTEFLTACEVDGLSAELPKGFQCTDYDAWGCHLSDQGLSSDWKIAYLLGWLMPLGNIGLALLLTGLAFSQLTHKEVLPQ